MAYTGNKQLWCLSCLRLFYSDPSWQTALQLKHHSTYSYSSRVGRRTAAAHIAVVQGAKQRVECTPTSGTRQPPEQGLEDTWQHEEEPWGCTTIKMTQRTRGVALKRGNKYIRPRCRSSYVRRATRTRHGRAACRSHAAPRTAPTKQPATRVNAHSNHACRCHTMNGRCVCVYRCKQRARPKQTLLPSTYLNVPWP